MLWYHYVTMVIFLSVVISPVWFFKQVEKFIMKNDLDEKYKYVDGHVSPDNCIQQYDNEESFLRDEKALANFDRLIKSTKKRDVKRLWKIKKAEYLREMRWKTLATVENKNYENARNSKKTW